VSCAERGLRIAVAGARSRGDAEGDLRRLADLASQAAREHDPDLILLPETLAGPAHGPYELLRALARRHGCWVGGGFVAVRGSAATSVYALAEPGGATHLHDKDQPDPWEARSCVRGIDDGFCATDLGPLGLAAGTEWIRTRAARRLRAAGVRLVVGGASRRSWLAPEAPGRMARMVGVPAAVAQQAPPGRERTAAGATRPARSAGDSQIVDREGRVLALLGPDDGDGYVAAEVRLSDPDPLELVPDAEWTVHVTTSRRAGWAVQGMRGRTARRLRQRVRRLPSPRGPRRDLLAYNPPPAGPARGEIT
jgi:predicted amidohydrolase